MSLEVLALLFTFRNSGPCCSPGNFEMFPTQAPNMLLFSHLLMDGDVKVLAWVKQRGTENIRHFESPMLTKEL